MGARSADQLSDSMANHPSPGIHENSDHAAVIAYCEQLRQTEIESFLARQTGSHSTALFLREVLYWFKPYPKDPSRPRCTVYRNGRYWACRTREQWKTEQALSRAHLEKAYRQCKDFLEVDHFMFASQRRTHYGLNFDKLRELMENDQVLRERLNRASSDVPKSRRPVGGKTSRPVGGMGPLPSVSSLEESKRKLNNTGCAGRGVPFSAPTALPEEPENPVPVPIPVPQVLGCLKNLEGKPQREKLNAVVPLGKRDQRALAYLLIWQAYFEQEYSKSPYFNSSHVFSAYQLSEEEVEIRRFGEVLREAWTIRGTSQPGDPLFMCRNHSRRFGLFCRHFTRMEDELLQSDES